MWKKPPDFKTLRSRGDLLFIRTCAPKYILQFTQFYFHLQMQVKCLHLQALPIPIQSLYNHYKQFYIQFKLCMITSTVLQWLLMLVQWNFKDGVWALHVFMNSLYPSALSSFFDGSGFIPLLPGLHPGHICSTWRPPAWGLPEEETPQTAACDLHWGDRDDGDQQHRRRES